MFLNICAGHWLSPVHPQRKGARSVSYYWRMCLFEWPAGFDPAFEVFDPPTCLFFRIFTHALQTQVISVHFHSTQVRQPNYLGNKK